MTPEYLWWLRASLVFFGGACLGVGVILWAALRVSAKADRESEKDLSQLLMRRESNHVRPMSIVIDWDDVDQAMLYPTDSAHSERDTKTKPTKETDK
jgi:hypothetical protein